MHLFSYPTIGPVYTPDWPVCTKNNVVCVRITILWMRGQQQKQWKWLSVHIIPYTHTLAAQVNNQQSFPLKKSLVKLLTVRTVMQHGLWWQKHYYAVCPTCDVSHQDILV